LQVTAAGLIIITAILKVFKARRERKLQVRAPFGRSVVCP
jgi:hypothetical protein